MTRDSCHLLTNHCLCWVRQSLLPSAMSDLLEGTPCGSMRVLVSCFSPSPFGSCCLRSHLIPGRLQAGDCDSPLCR